MIRKVQLSSQSENKNFEPKAFSDQSSETRIFKDNNQLGFITDVNDYLYPYLASDQPLHSREHIKTLFFIDSKVKDPQSIIDDLPSNSTYVLLDVNKDGLVRIAEA